MILPILSRAFTFPSVPSLAVYPPCFPISPAIYLDGYWIWELQVHFAAPIHLPRYTNEMVVEESPRSWGDDEAHFQKDGFTPCEN